MAVEEYRAWFEITNADTGHAGTTVGTAAAVASGTALLWYLEKAGMYVTEPVPITGRRFPSVVQR